MSYADWWIIGLLAAVVALSGLSAVAAIAAVEHLKDLKAWHFTVMDRLGTLDERLRDGDLRILKCLKGESYAGSLYGMDLHTDPAIPDGSMVFYSTKKRDADA